MSWWPAPTCSTPAAAAARTRSVPSCPVAPRMSSRSEDGIVLDDAFQRVVPLDEALVPVDRPCGRPVLQPTDFQCRVDLLCTALRCKRGLVVEAVPDLLEAHLIGAMVRVAVPVLDVRQPERPAQPFGEGPDLQILVI